MSALKNNQNYPPRSQAGAGRGQGGLYRTPSMEFKEITKRDAEVHLAQALDKLRRTGSGMGCLVGEQADIVDRDFDGFKRLFANYLNAAAKTGIDWNKIEPLPEGSIIPYKNLQSPSEKQQIKQMLDKLVVVKLNGGLGTSMGCRGPKSVIAVRNDLTFLDLTVQQIENLNRTYDSDVPLILMNSFNTEEDTAKVIRKYSQMRIRILTFNQSRYPRINRESLMPIAKEIQTEKDIDAWYPPGHGDFYQAFANSGLLDELIEKEGRSVCFMSNIDNMGATVDLSILHQFISNQNEFIMEVTNKTRADVKGGTLIEYEGKLRLLEVAQVPKPHLEEFKSIKKFSVFNTNNIWVKLEAIKQHVDERTLDMEVIVNPKSLEGAHQGVNVIQLETAVGAAMKCFDNCQGVNVPRSRFLPVKTCQDLLLIMSNLYSLNNGTLSMSPERMFQTTPLIKLGALHFQKVKDFLRRFSSIPDIIELDHLTVSGDVTFGKRVSLKGTVIIIANHGDRIDIPDGAILENKIVSGNLRILDH